VICGSVRFLQRHDHDSMSLAVFQAQEELLSGWNCPGAMLAIRFDRRWNTIGLEMSDARRHLLLLGARKGA
jgi:hypothetical protein